MDCLSFEEVKSPLLDKALSNQEMKETNGFTLDEIDTHMQVSGKVNFPEKKTCLGNVNQASKAPFVCKQI